MLPKTLAVQFNRHGAVGRQQEGARTCLVPRYRNTIFLPGTVTVIIPLQELVKIKIYVASKLSRLPASDMTAEDHGSTHALGHDPNARGRHQVVLDLDDLTILAVIEAALLEPVGQVGRNLQATRSFALLLFENAGLSG